MSAPFKTSNTCYLAAEGRCVVTNNEEPLVRCYGIDATSIVTTSCEAFNEAVKDNRLAVKPAILESKEKGGTVARFEQLKCSHAGGQDRYYHPTCDGFPDPNAGRTNFLYRPRKDKDTGIVYLKPVDQSHHVCKECYVALHGKEPEPLSGKQGLLALIGAFSAAHSWQLSS